jgi:hypothetical protein
MSQRLPLPLPAEMDVLTVNGNVNDVGASLGGSDHARRGDTGGVVRVHVDREVRVGLADRADEPARSADANATYSLAASGLSRPAMSLIPSTWIPSLTSLSVRSR